MCEFSQNVSRLLRFGTAWALALLLCAGTGLAASDSGRTDTSRMLIPVGHTVGVKLFARGVLVVRPPEGGTPANACGLQTGDVILQCAETAVTSTEQFQSLLQKSGGAATELEVRRDGGSVTLCVEPEANEQGVYCIGAWIRDSMAGIGTMTYYDPQTETFGALGHGITDVDTTLLMPFSNGSVLPSTVKAVKRGEAGSAGELKGAFDLTRDLGTLYANTTAGVFGTMEETCLPVQPSAVPTAAPAAGKAIILSNVRGDAVEAFDVEILKVISHPADERELVLSVTDPDLVAATGGIVQGMSGSPILQDGCIVGAVTHVLLNDPCKGYGISIETMLKASK